MKRLHVLVERGPHAKVRSEIYEYELPVLQAIHDSDELKAVSVIGELPPKADEREYEPEDAHRAMKVKYTQEDAAAALAMVYPTVEALVRSFPPGPPKTTAKATRAAA